jgi:hypothetical protein
MKEVFLWITFLLPTGVVFSQKPPDEAGKIILRNSFTQDENYRQVGRILLDNNFMIDYADRELGFINTEFLPTPYGDDPKLRIVVRDHEVVITGIIRTNGPDKAVYYCYLLNAGWPVSSRKSFRIMHNIAMKFPHEKVEFGFIQTDE